MIRQRFKGYRSESGLPSLQGGSFEITLTVPLITVNKIIRQGKKLQSSPYISKHDFSFQFFISTKLSSSLDTHKQGNKEKLSINSLDTHKQGNEEKLSINSFSLITCNLFF